MMLPPLNVSWNGANFLIYPPHVTVAIMVTNTPILVSLRLNLSLKIYVLCLWVYIKLKRGFLLDPVPGLTFFFFFLSPSSCQYSSCFFVDNDPILPSLASILRSFAFALELMPTKTCSSPEHWIHQLPKQYSGWTSSRCLKLCMTIWAWNYI